MSKEIWYERITAIRLTQENEDGKLESRFFPQIERTEIDDCTGESSTDWVVIIDDGGEAEYFLEETMALKSAMEYRDRNGKVYL